jgi:hypothetical protein
LLSWFTAEHETDELLLRLVLGCAHGQLTPLGVCSTLTLHGNLDCTHCWLKPLASILLCCCKVAECD